MSRGQVGLGLVSQEQVATLDTNLDGQITSLNTAITSCTTMTATDLQAWQGFYNGWENGPHALWAQYQQWLPTYSVGGAISTALNWGGIIGVIQQMPDLYSEMLGYANQLPTWQAKVQKECPNYSPPPGIPTPVPLPDYPWWNFLSTPAKILGGIALTAAVGYGAFQVLEIAVPLLAAGAATRAIEQRPAGRRRPRTTRNSDR